MHEGFSVDIEPDPQTGQPAAQLLFAGILWGEVREQEPSGRLVLRLQHSPDLPPDLDLSLVLHSLQLVQSMLLQTDITESNLRELPSPN